MIRGFRRAGRVRVRRVAGIMNKTEQRYADLLTAGGREWKYEALTLKLADDCRYTPDFAVVAADGVLELHEVKGQWRDDARVKIRVAADTFPWFRFLAIRYDKGAWSVERFGPEDAAA